MKRVLITGADGRIGSHLVDRLKDKYHITGLDIADDCDRKTDCIKCDISSLDDIKRQLKNDQFDYVVHCAAITHSAERFSDSDLLRVNVEGTKNLVKFFTGSGIKSFILFSSVAVYGESDYPGSITEQFPKKPNTAYGISKDKAEGFLSSSGLPYTILRFPAVYSLSLLKNIEKRVLFAEKFGVDILFKFGSAQQKHTFCFIENVDKAVEYMLCNSAKTKNEIFHVADHFSYTSGEIIKIFINRAKRDDRKLMIVPFPKVFLKLFLYLLSVFSREKKDYYRSIYWKLSEDNRYSTDKLKQAGFNFPDYGKLEV